VYVCMCSDLMIKMTCYDEGESVMNVL